jgi:hypothetical protein
VCGVGGGDVTGWVLVVLLLGMPQRVPTDDVAAILRSYHWREPAVAWFVATVDTEIGLGAVVPGDAGHYYQAQDGARPRIAVRYLSPSVVEHEAHHAWDHLRGPSPEERRLDFVALQHDPVVGSIATSVLADRKIGESHYGHALIERLDYDPRSLPAWYRDRHFGYLGDPPVRHRLVLPVAGR